MKVDLSNAKFILAHAGVRYWEDAKVNGVEDEDGTLIPGRDGETWVAKIELATGKIVDWPEGTEADIHYKVCDDGEYWLLDEAGEKVAYREGYVPGEFMCHGDSGYGDYIIMKVGADGQIAQYQPPHVDADDWKNVPA